MSKKGTVGVCMYIAGMDLLPWLINQTSMRVLAAVQHVLLQCFCNERGGGHKTVECSVFFLIYDNTLIEVP